MWRTSHEVWTIIWIALFGRYWNNRYVSLFQKIKKLSPFWYLPVLGLSDSTTCLYFVAPNFTTPSGPLPNLAQPREFYFIQGPTLPNYSYNTIVKSPNTYNTSPSDHCTWSLLEDSLGGRSRGLIQIDTIERTNTAQRQSSWQYPSTHNLPQSQEIFPDGFGFNILVYSSSRPMRGLPLSCWKRPR